MDVEEEVESSSCIASWASKRRWAWKRSSLGMRAAVGPRSPVQYTKGKSNTVIQRVAKNRNSLYL